MRTATLLAIASLSVLVLASQALPAEESEVAQQRASREAVAEPRRRSKDGPRKQRKGAGRRKAVRRKAGKRKAGKRKAGKMAQTRKVTKGNDCEYILLPDITNNSGCTDGFKFVLKGAAGVRRQFLIMNSKATLAFVEKGKKFTACSAYTDITASVTCKEVAGLVSVDLSASAAVTNAPVTNAPVTNAPATNAPATEAPATEAPTKAPTNAPAEGTILAAATTTATAAATAATSNATCKCGIKNTNRIVGGSEATENEYPWIAIFGDAQGDNLGGCSSTLIADRWAITASHCFYNQEGTQQVLHEADMTVVLGIHDRTVVVTPDTPPSLRQPVKIAKINLHPQYHHLTSKNDIALLRLETAVPLQRYTPACLPAKGDDFTGKNGWVYGWGIQTENGQELAEKLQELEVLIVSDSVCGTAMDAEGIEISQDMLCAGGELNKDACGGDSGGPFTVAGSDGAHTLAGAVSFGVGCGKAGLYGVYAEVAQFRDWIDSTIAAGGGATFCNNGA